MKLTSGIAAIVTGGASGLGEGTARMLASRGVKVGIFDMNEARGEAVAKEIGGVFAKVNVADNDSVDAGFAAVRKVNGQERVMVNCAGIATAEKTLGRDGPHAQASFERTLAINLSGTFNVARLAAARMDAGGVIVNTASVAAFDGQREFVVMQLEAQGPQDMAIGQVDEQRGKTHQQAGAVPGLEPQRAVDHVARDHEPNGRDQ